MTPKGIFVYITCSLFLQQGTLRLSQGKDRVSGEQSEVHEASEDLGWYLEPSPFFLILTAKANHRKISNANSINIWKEGLQNYLAWILNTRKEITQAIFSQSTKVFFLSVVSKGNIQNVFSHWYSSHLLIAWHQFFMNWFLVGRADSWPLDSQDVGWQVAECLVVGRAQNYLLNIL